MTVARFWRKIPQRYNLIGTKCENCNTIYFPPRSLCPDCRRDGTIVDHTCCGKGTVVTFSVIRTASDQFSNMTPYVLAIIELEEGCRLTSQVICDPTEVSIGMKVKSVFRVIAEDGPSGIIHYGTKFVPV